MIEFNQRYSTEKGMRSVIKFEVNQSTVATNFLDVTIALKNNKLQTTLYSKPTDAHLYLNKSSNHPKHVTRNLPKGQFIRIRRICSETTEYIRNCNILSKYLLKRGYSEKLLQGTMKEVLAMKREDLLCDKQKEKNLHSTIWCSNHRQ